MGQVTNLVGKVFNRLTVLKRTTNLGKSARWRCLCICGNIAEAVTTSNLIHGKTVSCGCKNVEILVAANKARALHGLSNTKAYKAWWDAVDRCTNKNNHAYIRYGGRGIGICSQWLTFENFLEDMGHPGEGLSLDRIDNNKGYSPDNCRWATISEQNRNRRTNRLLEFNGKIATITEHCEDAGMHVSTAISRLDQLKWSVEKTFSTPNNYKAETLTWEEWQLRKK